MADVEFSKAEQNGMPDDWETRQSRDTQLITITVAYLKTRKKVYKNGSDREKQTKNEEH